MKVGLDEVERLWCQTAASIWCVWDFYLNRLDAVYDLEEFRLTGSGEIYP